MDKVDKMRVFLQVAELGSFSRAAETLSLPKATVSGCIKDLESDFRIRLFQRTTRKIQLTQEGLGFIERVRQLIQNFDEFDQNFKDNKNEIEGRLRIDVGVRIANDLLIPRLPEFVERYPGIRLELSSTDRKVDLINEGFDCVLRIGNLKDSNLIAKKLGTLTLVNCVSPSYIEKYGKPRRLEDLDKHYLVNYSSTLGTTADSFEYFDGTRYRTINMKYLITVNNTIAYKAACLAGFGIVQAPIQGARDLLKKGQLVEVLPKHRAEPMPVTLLFPHRSHIPKRVQVFSDWFESILSGYLG